MSEITILHLSDIHSRKKKSKNKDDENKLFRQDVQQKLIDAVSRHLKENTAPGVVAVTGDIAYDGKKPGYDEALEFFAKLKRILPKETEFLAVPGNHDVDRDQLDEFVEPYYVVKSDLVDKLLQQPDKIKKKVHVKFKAFREFSRELNPTFYKTEDDYFWVKNFSKKNISLLGLNSAWACEGDQDRFNIALGQSQVLAAIKKSKEAQIANRIVLMHHPPFNWLKDLETGKTRVELFKNCQLLLHGHVHADDLLVYQNPAGSCICLGANASYTEDKDGFIGFQFLEVDFIEQGRGRGVRVKVWPYYLHEKRNEFVPDRERWPSGRETVFCH